MHYPVLECECKSCTTIKQHKAIQAYGAANKEQIVRIGESLSLPPRNEDDQQHESLLLHAPCLEHAERNFLWGMAVDGAVVMLVLPTALYLLGALK